MLAVGVGGAVTLMGTSLVLVNAGAAPVETVDICHATSDSTNPYLVQSVNADSGDLDGHVGHTGPVYFEGFTGDWGDIIPPVPDILPDGLNWPDGETIWQNEFVFDAPSPTQT